MVINNANDPIKDNIAKNIFFRDIFKKIAAIIHPVNSAKENTKKRLRKISKKANI